MPQTQNYGLRYPQGSDTRNVPRDLGYLASDTDAALVTLATAIANATSVTSGTLAARPAASKLNRVYIVRGDSTPANNGLIFLDTGTTWQQVGGGGSTVRAVAASASDVPVRSTGVASQTGNLLEAVNSGGTTVWAVKPTGRVLTPAENQEYTYNSDGSLATATTKIGTTTVRAVAFTYNSDGTIASTSDAHDGVTDASTYAYTTANGTTVPSTISRTRS